MPSMFNFVMEKEDASSLRTYLMIKVGKKVLSSEPWN